MGIPLSNDQLREVSEVSGVMDEDVLDFIDLRVKNKVNLFPFNLLKFGARRSPVRCQNITRAFRGLIILLAGFFSVFNREVIVLAEWYEVPSI